MDGWMDGWMDIDEMRWDGMGSIERECLID